MLPGIPDSMKSIYIYRHATPGLSPFLEIEVIKSEAAKSISSHNGYKYKDFSGKKPPVSVK
jgi:hypothetical protein